MRNKKLKDIDLSALYDYNAEMYAVGSILLEPSLLEEYSIAPNDFYSETLGKIYMAIMVLYGEGKKLNLYEIAEKVRELYDIPIKETSQLLIKLANAVIAPFNGIVYAKRVKELAEKRQLFNGVIEAEETIISGEPMEKAVAMLEKTLSMIAPTEKLTPLKDAFDLKEVDELINKKAFHTHLTKLNDSIRLTKGELISVVGDTSRGKTQLTLNVVDDVIKQKGKVLYFSIDMDRTQLIMRLISMHQMVALSELKPDNPKFKDYFKKELSDTEYYSYLYEFHKTTDIRSVVHIARAINPDLVIFDYIQNFRDPIFATNRAQELSSIMLLLQQEAQRYPIIALSQVSKGNGDVGLLERAKGTSTIGQASSVIIEVDREDDRYRYRIRKNRTWGLTSGWIDLRMYYGFLTEI